MVAKTRRLHGLQNTVVNEVRTSRFRSKKSGFKIWPKNGSFGGKGGLNFRFGFCDTEKAHPCTNRVFWCILCQNLCGSLGCRWLEEPDSPPQNEHSSGVN